MRVLCVSAPLAGHLDWGGYLPTAATLQQRGHEVLWASRGEVHTAVAAAGIGFAPVNETGWRWPPPPPLLRPEHMNDQTWHRVRAKRALDQWLDPPRVLRAVDALSRVVADFRPDLIMSEVFIAAAGIVAEQVGAPFVVAGWPALETTDAQSDNPLIAIARARLERLLAAGRVTGLNFTATGPPALRSPRLHLTYWSAGWYAGLPLAPQTHHIGGLPMVASEADPTLPEHETGAWIIITLGTSFNRDPAFFLAAAHAAAQLGRRPILLLGRTPDPAEMTGWMQRLPASAVVRTTVDLRSVLPYAAAAIHHGGAGTTHALVRSAVPQIVVPHAADQIHQAHGVIRTGIGLHLAPKAVTVASLTTALAALLPDLATYRQQACALQVEFAGLGGVPAAARLLEETCP